MKNETVALDRKLGEIAGCYVAFGASSQNSPHKLKIIGANQSQYNKRDNLLLALEKLVAKEKENQDLKEQILILRAQLKDMSSLLTLRRTY